MKRGFWIIPLVVLVIAAANTSVWSYYNSPDKPEWNQLDEEIAKDPVGFQRFAAECEEVFSTIRSTVSTYVNAVMTVLRAVINVVMVIVVSVVKFAVRFVFTVVMALAQWIVAVVL